MYNLVLVKVASKSIDSQDPIQSLDEEICRTKLHEPVVLGEVKIENQNQAMFMAQIIEH